ncbi:MAG: orotate phosphoribosyltransferase [Buchnera aphidicola (Floraphis choui)]
MNHWNLEFIKFCFEKKILQFGNFKLKSGKKSSFFFNSSLFNTGNDLEKLGYFYAKAIIENKINYDLLFGVAYKGIPIVISTAIALKKHFNVNVSYCFNRKEIKNHGEQGRFIGKDLKKNILILDDVITSGLSIRNTVEIIKLCHKKRIYNNLISGIVVALDRRKNTNLNLNLNNTKNKYDLKIISIININDIINYIKHKKNLHCYLNKIEKINFESNK